MIRIALLELAGALAVFMGAEALAHGLGYEHRGGMMAMPTARAASPSDLSPYGASCKHCIPIAETAK